MNARCTIRSDCFQLPKTGHSSTTWQPKCLSNEKASVAITRPSKSTLLQAVRHAQLGFYLQPIMHLESGAICDFEALIRWPHKGVVLSPNVFVEQALQRPINRLFQALCNKQLVAIFTRMQTHYSNCYLTMNAPAHFFYSKSSVMSFIKLMQRHQVSTNRLVIELLESDPILNHANVINNIEMLRKLGIRIALDDFGKEHSNMDRMKDFPVDIVKIDRCFAENLAQDRRSQAIIKAIIAMGKSLHFSVVAEGAETAQQVGILKQLGITHCQGYYLGRPQPSEYWLAKPQVQFN
ncbi:MAG TPA: hypothetical protein DE179_11420 [Oceanospirillaceae bacterium]|nr:hypothetical protein [Oceanospirillaceae bacterium]